MPKTPITARDSSVPTKAEKPVLIYENFLQEGVFSPSFQNLFIVLYTLPEIANLPLLICLIRKNEQEIEQINVAVSKKATCQ